MKALGKEPPPHIHFSACGEYNIECDCDVAEHYRTALLDLKRELNKEAERIEARFGGTQASRWLRVKANECAISAGEEAKP